MLIVNTRDTKYGTVNYSYRIWIPSISNVDHEKVKWIVGQFEVKVEEHLSVEDILVGGFSKNSV